MVCWWQRLGRHRRILDVLVFSPPLISTLSSPSPDTINPDTAPAKIYGYTVLMGVGAGTYLASSFAVVQALVPVDDLSNAVGFMSVAQDLGIVFFLAVAGTIYQNTAIKNIMSSVPGTSRGEVFEIIAGTSSPAFMSLSPSVQTEVVAQIIKSMSGVWALLIAGMALSFVLSLFLGVSYFFSFEL